MAQMIAVFRGGQAALIDTESPHSITIDGQEPIGLLPVTQANLDTYLPGHKNQGNIKI